MPKMMFRKAILSVLVMALVGSCSSQVSVDRNSNLETVQEFKILNGILNKFKNSRFQES